MNILEKYLNEELKGKDKAKEALKIFFLQNYDKFNDAKSRADAIGDKKLVNMINNIIKHVEKIK